MSFGIAEFDREGDETAEAVLKRADVALYESKHTGRNRVTLAPPPLDATQPVPTTE
jgi:PleD family two-component response regulator